VYKKTQILLQYETAHWVPNMKMLLIMLVKFGILGKEPKKKKRLHLLCCCVKILVSPKWRKEESFWLWVMQKSPHKCRVIVNVLWDRSVVPCLYHSMASIEKHKLWMMC